MFQLLFDFSLMFPEVNDQALIGQWDKIEKKPFEMYQIDINDEDPIFNCDSELHSFFLYLKMLPTHKIKFKNAVKSFMVFSQVKRIIKFYLIFVHKVK